MQQPSHTLNKMSPYNRCDKAVGTDQVRCATLTMMDSVAIDTQGEPCSDGRSDAEGAGIDPQDDGMQYAIPTTGDDAAGPTLMMMEGTGCDGDWTTEAVEMESG